MMPLAMFRSRNVNVAMAVGFAFVVGYFVIIAFLKIVSTFSYTPFVVYRLVLAALVVLLLLTGVLEPGGTAASTP